MFEYREAHLDQDIFSIDLLFKDFLDLNNDLKRLSVDVFVDPDTDTVVAEELELR
jgi:hypothetical protein